MASGKMMGIVAWSLAGVLALGLVAAAFMAQQQSIRAAGMGEALAQVVSVVGEEEIDPAEFKDVARRTEIAQAAQEAIQTLRAELLAADDALTAARNEASTARSEATGASQRIQELEAQAEAHAQELEKAAGAAEAARAEAEKTVEEAVEAQAEAEKKLERLQNETNEEIARLQAEIQAMKAAPAAPEDGTAEEPGADMTDVIAEVLAETKERHDIVEEGRFIGPSQMFSRIRYSEDQTLLFELLDGQTLTYHDVPPDVVEQLIAASDRLDVTFRFRIQGEYRCLPPDRVVIRKYWKWLRRHRTRAEVRFIGPEPEEPPAEETPAEESES